MSNLLNLTNLPKFRSSSKPTQTNKRSGYKQYDSTDYMTFITSSNAGDLNQDSNRFYDSIRRFVTSKNTSDLINLDKHKSTFFNSTPTDIIPPVNGDGLLTQVSLACYLNTAGLLTRTDQISALHNHFVKGTGEVEEEDVSSHELFAGMDDSSKLIKAATVLKSNQLKSVFAAAEEAAEKRNRSKTGSSVKITEEDVRMDLEKVMLEGRFNSTTVLNELAVQFLEPEAHIDHFLRVTSNWTTLPHDSRAVDEFESKICNKTINLTSRLITCREELYNMVMPLRFRLQDQDSTPALDVLTQQLLGASAGDTRAFYEICKFADLAVFKNTSEIIEKIKADLEVIDSSDGDHTTRLINEWGRGVCFVSYVEIVRNILLELIELEIHPIDSELRFRQLEGDEEVEHSEVSALTLYYYKGWYYGRPAGQALGFTSTCFRTLLAKFLSL